MMPTRNGAAQTGVIKDYNEPPLQGLPGRLKLASKAGCGLMGLVFFSARVGIALVVP